MRLHEREKTVALARVDILKSWMRICKDYDLTDGEALSVLSGFVGTELGQVAKHMIRIERHGDPEALGGVASDDDTENEDAADG